MLNLISIQIRDIKGKVKCNFVVLCFAFKSFIPIVISKGKVHIKLNWSV